MRVTVKDRQRERIYALTSALLTVLDSNGLYREGDDSWRRSKSRSMAIRVAQRIDAALWETIGL